MNAGVGAGSQSRMAGLMRAADAFRNVRAVVTLFATFLLVFLVSALFGIAFPFMANNLFFNSCALFAILYLVVPIVRERFASSRVEASEYYRDDVANFIARYAGLIVVGFGSGNGAALMYVWATTKELGFLWLLLNLVILCVLLELALLKEIGED